MLGSDGLPQTRNSCYRTEVATGQLVGHQPGHRGRYRAVVQRLRSAEPHIVPVELAQVDQRHAEWAHGGVTWLLATRLPEVLGALSGAQRHSVAAERALDAAERAEALDLLVTGWDPESATSRVWQMCEVTRSMSFGETGPLLSGGAEVGLAAGVEQGLCQVR